MLTLFLFWTFREHLFNIENTLQFLTHLLFWTFREHLFNIENRWALFVKKSKRILFISRTFLSPGTARMLHIIYHNFALFFRHPLDRREKIKMNWIPNIIYYHIKYKIYARVLFLKRAKKKVRNRVKIQIISLPYF
jgi:hypothetical protein